MRSRFLPAATLLDFGSGAGLPGIPIAIVRPDIRVTLGESQRKKAAFLREAVRVLSLPSEVYDGRIENMPTSRVFDAVTLRAVDKMAEACRTAIERVAPGGWLVVFATSTTGPVLQQLPKSNGASVCQFQVSKMVCCSSAKSKMFHVEHLSSYRL